MPTWEIQRNGKVIGEIESDQPPDRKTVLRAMSELDKQGVLPPVISTPETANPNVIPDDVWAQMPAQEKIHNVLRYMGGALGGAFMPGADVQTEMDNPKTALALAAIPAAGKAVKPLLPSMERAGATIGRVTQKAKNVPVNMTEAGNKTMRAMELTERGSSKIKPVTDLFKRLVDPNKGDMTFEEARDFYSSITKLSARDISRLNGPMRKAVVEIRNTFNEAMGEAAGQVGQKETYKSAMKEYARAARLHNLTEKLKKYALPAGVGVGVAHYGIDKVSNIARSVAP